MMLVSMVLSTGVSREKSSSVMVLISASPVDRHKTQSPRCCWADNWPSPSSFLPLVTRPDKDRKVTSLSVKPQNASEWSSGVSSIRTYALSLWLAAQALDKTPCPRISRTRVFDAEPVHPADIIWWDFVVILALGTRSELLDCFVDPPAPCWPPSNLFRHWIQICCRKGIEGIPASAWRQNWVCKQDGGGWPLRRGGCGGEAVTCLCAFTLLP